MLRNLDDDSVPSLDQAWKDIYGTNNGEGPNSRSRRFRQRFTERYSSQNNTGQQLALLELKNGEGGEDAGEAKGVKNEEDASAGVGVGVAAGHPPRSCPQAGRSTRGGRCRSRWPTPSTRCPRTTTRRAGGRWAW